MLFLLISLISLIFRSRCTSFGLDTLISGKTFRVASDLFRSPSISSNFFMISFLPYCSSLWPGSKGTDSLTCTLQGSLWPGRYAAHILVLEVEHQFLELDGEEFYQRSWSTQSNLVFSIVNIFWVLAVWPKLFILELFWVGLQQQYNLLLIWNWCSFQIWTTQRLFVKRYSTDIPLWQFLGAVLE